MRRYTLLLYALLPVVHLLLAGSADAQTVFDRCSLAKELDRLSVPRDEIPKWVFIANALSNYRTDAVSRANSRGFRHFGIFQIGDQWWCKSEKGTSNVCNVDCNLLLSDNLKHSLDCAQVIKSQMGWSAWAKGEIEIEDCFEKSQSQANVTSPSGAPAHSEIDFPVSSLASVGADNCEREFF